MNTKRCMVICRSVKELSLITSLDNDSCEIIVATNDIETRAEALKRKEVAAVAYLDQMVSFYQVREDALIVFDAINAWLRDICRGVPSYLIEWTKHVEGGMTTQKIVDLLLLIESYVKIIKQHNIQKIIIKCNSHTLIEDTTILLAAKSMQVECEEHASPAHIILRSLALVKINKRIFGLALALYLPLQVIAFYLKMACVARIVFAWFPGDVGSPSKENQKVVFLLGSSADKHSDNLTQVMSEFDKNGYVSIAACWNASGGRKKLIKKGLHAVNLESRITLRDLIRTYHDYRQIKKAIARNLRFFPAQSPLVHKGVSLNRQLVPSLKYFITFDLLNRLLMKRAFERFFVHADPAAMKSYGGNRLDLGRIACETLRNMGRKTLVFDYWIGLNINDGDFGAPPSGCLDLQFVHCEYDKEYLERTQPKLAVAVTGYSRSSVINNFKTISRERSADRIGLVNRNQVTILYASTGIINGYISLAEAEMILESVILMAKTHSKVTLLVRPHPNEPITYMQEMIKRYENIKNITLVDKTASIYDLINASDIVITKYSAVGIEAMLFERPVISLAFDGEHRLQDIFGEGADKFQSRNKFLAFFIDILSSDDKYTKWRETMLRKQKVFLQHRFYQPPEPIEKIMVHTVIAEIYKRNDISCDGRACRNGAL